MAALMSQLSVVRQVPRRLRHKTPRLDPVQGSQDAAATRVCPLAALPGLRLGLGASSESDTRAQLEVATVASEDSSFCHRTRKPAEPGFLDLALEQRLDLESDLDHELFPDKSNKKDATHSMNASIVVETTSCRSSGNSGSSSSSVRCRPAVAPVPANPLHKKYAQRSRQQQVLKQPSASADLVRKIWLSRKQHSDQPSSFGSGTPGAPLQTAAPGAALDGDAGLARDEEKLRLADIQLRRVRSDRERRLRPYRDHCYQRLLTAYSSAIQQVENMGIDTNSLTDDAFLSQEDWELAKEAHETKRDWSGKIRRKNKRAAAEAKTSSLLCIADAPANEDPLEDRVAQSCAAATQWAPDSAVLPEVAQSAAAQLAVAQSAPLAGLGAGRKRRDRTPTIRRPAAAGGRRSTQCPECD
jgi:hypothetical protein